ncbi:hypothetical protein HDV02_002982 [Globomyces sp. JEL0801]|nr:hypothetical protein HDV02_002982 [Globomyces sp. JEL0801]
MTTTTYFDSFEMLFNLIMNVTDIAIECILTPTAAFHKYVPLPENRKFRIVNPDNFEEMGVVDETKELYCKKAIEGVCDTAATTPQQKEKHMENLPLQVGVVPIYDNGNDYSLLPFSD